MTPLGLRESWVQPLGDFSLDGKTFFVAIAGAYGKPPNSDDVPILMVARLEGFKGIPVLAISKEGDKLVSRKDTNHDGKIAADDTAVELTMLTRWPVAARWGRNGTFASSGSTTCRPTADPDHEQAAYIWKCTA
jgi:hypothetical protein